MTNIKMRGGHYQRMRALIEQTIAERSLVIDKIMKDYRANGLSYQRFRWDVLWMSEPDARRGLLTDCYAYLNDDHIDSALRRVFAELKKEERPCAK